MLALLFVMPDLVLNHRVIHIDAIVEHLTKIGADTDVPLAAILVLQRRPLVWPMDDTDVLFRDLACHVTGSYNESGRV